MKYYDPATRKRPEWNEFYNKVMGYVYCTCGAVLQHQQNTFEHWQNGHFDEYEEYKPKEEIEVRIKTREIIEELVKIGCIPPIEKRKGFDYDSLKKEQ